MLPRQHPGECPKGAYLRWGMDCGQGVGSPQTGIRSSGASVPLLPSTHMDPGGTVEQVYLRYGCKRVFAPIECGLCCPGLAQLSPAQLLLPPVSTPLAPPQFGALTSLGLPQGTPWVIPISWYLGKGDRSWDTRILPSKNGP